eukprot:10290899-Heterocapsa_arctica.AAC.1
MTDLGHIKSREAHWARSQGLQLGRLIKDFRQEELAKRSLNKAISATGKPQEDEDIWNSKLKDCGDWEAQKLIDIGQEMAAIGERRNCD